MASKKTEVIKNIFEARYNRATRQLSSHVVTLEEVSDAIRRWGSGLSDRNPANFMKDVVRTPGRNDNFPQSVVQAGFTVRQDTAGGRCFVFLPLPPGQTTAFLENTPDPTLVANPHPIQSVSLPPVSRDFGRPQETWITHVVTTLNVVHAHLALRSPLNFIGVELLQSNVGLGEAEIDALYLGTLRNGTNVLVSCEMKGAREVLDEDQIERGAQRVAQTASSPIEVVPLGVKALSGGLLWLVEFDRRLPPIAKVSEGVYSLTPSVPGIR